MNGMHRFSVITTVALILAAGVTSPAHAAAPSNDGVGNAKAATGIGYTDSVNVSRATSGRRDPTNCANSASVWYRYTPRTTETINVNTNGSNYDTVIGAYTGRPGALTRVACRDDGVTSRAALDLEVQAGTTYYFMVGACCGNGRAGLEFQRQLLLQFRMTEPLSIEQLAAGGTGTVGRADGEAQVTVSRQCSPAAEQSVVEASLRQRVGGTFVARSFSFRRAPCGTASSDISLRFPPRGDIAFGEGPATVSVRLTACSQGTGTCTRRSITGAVVLAFR